ncbi:hypothetical protein LR48_Vigan07g148900 [Vigna angularis]|uniref:Uncharacterized protein n=1 Tax=Phaseolus angularis TaxID=3914 RepID=A0A0L9UY35_PHAAN|nr:hypothetical protein LR48_Vigan07g148900 [Vigna angularis]
MCFDVVVCLFRSRLRIGYYQRLGARHLPSQKDQITKPERTLVAQRTNVRRPASGRSSSEEVQRGRSPNEWTLVQRRSPTRTLDQRVDARPASGRPLPSKWTLAQRVDAYDSTSGRSPSEKWTFAQRSVDVRPTSCGCSPSETLAQREEAARPAKNHLQPFSLKTRSKGRESQSWRGEVQRGLSSSRPARFGCFQGGKSPLSTIQSIVYRFYDVYV